MVYTIHHRSFNNLSTILRQLGLTQLRTDQCVYYKENLVIMVYVDDLLLSGPDTEIQSFLKTLEAELQLKHVTKLQRHTLLISLGRQIEYYNDHIAMEHDKGVLQYLITVVQDTGEHECIDYYSNKRPPIEEEEYLTPEEHSLYRTVVGKQLWMRPLRPDIQHATKELTRTLQQPNIHDQKNLKHLLRYLHGTKKYRLHLRVTRWHS
eukprot:1034008-Amphidinium_carterae.1